MGYAVLTTSTGANNTGVGASALNACTTGNANTAVGQGAAQAITTGASNIAVGLGALEAVTTSDNNVALGRDAGASVTTGGNNIIIGRDAGITGSPGGAITTGSNEIVLGDENISKANIQVDWTIASDKRDKTDVEPMEMGLDFVNKLEPVTYKWDKRSKYVEKGEDFREAITDGTHKEEWLDTGFLAQDVEVLESEYGYNIADKTNLTTTLSDDGNQYGLTYSKFVPMLVKAVQELSAEVEQLKQKAHDKCDNNGE